MLMSVPPYTDLAASNGAGEPIRATVQAPRSIGSAILTVNLTTHWPTGTFIATTGSLESDGTLNPTTAQVFYGTASGTTITITSFAAGYTDLGNEVGDVVVLKPTTEWANVVSNSMVYVAGIVNESAAGWNVLNYPLTYGTNNGNKEFTVTSPNDLRPYLSPGMKLQVTRNTTPPTQCMSFSAASSQYASIASPSGITFTTAFTCEAWVYPTSYATAVIMSRTDSSASNGFQFYMSVAGQIAIDYASGGNSTTFQSYQAIPLNQWTHVAGVISSVSSKTGAIYINGTSVPTTTPLSAATSMTQSGSMGIGANQIVGTPANFFNGYISEARVWSVAQSQASIQANMAINLTTATNLVACYQGNGAWTDSSGNANTLTASGGASNTQAANPYNAIEYGVITSVSYSNPTTTLKVYTGNSNTIPNQTLNSPYYSVVSNPYGFNSDKGNWTIQIPFDVGLAPSNLSSNTFQTTGGQISLPTGSWFLGMHGDMQITSNSSQTDTFGNYGLSTSNNSTSDARLFRFIRISGASATLRTAQNIDLDIPVTLSTQTIYYLLINPQATNSSSFTVFNVNSSLGQISARCAYI